MAQKFPHLTGSTPFPEADGVDAYAYANDFDYTRYSANVTVKLLSVPWDGDYNDVVDFGGEGARDAWLGSAAGESVELPACMCRVPSESINVPLTYQAASAYNYCVVTAPVQTSAGDQVDYANARTYCYFISSMDFAATNTTRLNLTVDWWQTYRYGMDIPFIQLERGHWPMAQVTPEAFLESPLRMSRYLLAPDINYGEPSQVTSVSDYVFNNDSVAIIALAAEPTGQWANSAGDLRMPVSNYYNQQGAPTYRVIAVDVTRLGDLLSTLDDQYPQFKSAVKGVFFVGRALLTLGSEFNLAGVPVHMVSASQKSVRLMDLSPSLFDIPAPYNRIAKLYTYPYSKAVVTDERGNTLEVRIEDTTGYIDTVCCAAVAYPFIGIEAMVSSVGAYTARSTVFSQLSQRSRTYQGEWYDNLMSWDIPVFEVFQQPRVREVYAGKWNRDAAQLSADNALASANASADTAKANTTNSTSAQTRNNSLSVALASGNVARNNAASVEITNIGNSTSQAAQAYDAGLQRGVQEADASAVAATTLTNAIGNLAGSVASGLMSGGPAGAIAGAVGSAISGVTSGVNAAVMLNAASEKVELSISNSQSKVSSQNNSNTSITNQSNDTQSDNVSASNTASTSMTANSVNAANTNATNAQATAKANAARTKQSAQRSIDNTLKTANLQPPIECGTFSGDMHAAISPQLMSANIVTQSAGHMALAGDAMLRYGYMYSGQVSTGGRLQIMGAFTYWQGAAAIRAKGCPMDAVDTVKAAFAQGVTVWSDPAKVNNTSIYEN